jgi:hypothetical protein
MRSDVGAKAIAQTIRSDVGAKTIAQTIRTTHAANFPEGHCAYMRSMLETEDFGEVDLRFLGKADRAYISRSSMTTYIRTPKSMTASSVMELMVSSRT